MSKSVLLSYIIIADVTRIKREIKIEKKTHKNTILSGANSQATELSSATGRVAEVTRKLPVVLRNETQTNITIHPRTIIAEMRAVQEVMESGHTHSSVVNQKLPARSNLKFDFEDSPLTPEWKKRITDQLNNMPEVLLCTN